MNLIVLGLIFIVVCLAGCYLAYLYGHKTKRFRWGEYIAIIIWPILCVVAMAILIDYRALILFIVSSFIGFMLEWFIGFIYFKVLNKRLWKYKRFSVGGHTSFLSIPMWGVAGVIFWYISKTIGM